MLPAVPVAASSAPSLDLDPSVATWGVLGALVVAMLAIDLLVFARDHTPPLREAAAWSVAWLVVAVAFGGLFWAWQGGEAGGQFFAGYLLERTLSLDNVFVFAVILDVLRGARRRPAEGALVGHRAGARAAARAHPRRRGAARRLPRHLLRLRRACCSSPRGSSCAARARRWRPIATAPLRLLPRRLRAKPLVVVFVVVATTDVVFAIDSIPAIFAVTSEPFVVFAANAFAVLGLRALYFLLAGMMDRFVYLSHGLALILAVIGAKMLLIDVWHPPIWLSLGVIVTVLAATVALSLRAEPEGSAA